MLNEIQRYLPEHPWREHIHWFDTIDSTNTYAKQLAVAGAPEGTVVIADQQAGGRGRLGRSFSSPSGMGIYLSVILRPNCRPEELMHLTCAAGIAAANAIGNPRIGIKWTNDLVLGKRKLGGILTELSVDSATGTVAWAVIGIGINCCQKPADFPAEIRDIACSLKMDEQDIPPLTAELIRKLYDMRQNLLTNKKGLMEEYTCRCITIGQSISILQGNDVRHAVATGVDENGGLTVCYRDGSTETVTSGEVSIRGMYGYV